ncbi:MAG: 4-hydroxythreonine-4-phosphate dehydrogenase [Thermoleophilia bacterium]|nr:4-hydroxythreonine-4-phosphate dehydrogenase [Thermoleophilia bacterium]
MTRPLLALTLGDVAGISGEITAKALLLHPDTRALARMLVIGDVDAVRAGARHSGLDEQAVVPVEDARQCGDDPDRIYVLQTGPSLAHVPLGAIHPDAGDGAVRFVRQACTLAKEGLADGIVTAPLNKAAMHAAGHRWPGHTELLAHEFGVERYSLVLSAGDLYLFHATTHVSLRQAIDDLTRERVAEVIRLAAGFARAVGDPDATIAVAGLNPHAGEERLFGDEDADRIRPAVEECVAGGIDAVGPLPADALIPAAMRRGAYRFVVACYHDQGHVPFKAVYGDDGVNITVGLPTVRVSVDHGTAFDIAGRGIAREESLVLAIERAAALAPRWDDVWHALSRGAG